MPGLVHFQHFEIPTEMFRISGDLIAEAYPSGHGVIDYREVIVPGSSGLPGGKCTFVLGEVVFSAVQAAGVVTVAIMDAGGFECVGSYRPGKIGSIRLNPNSALGPREPQALVEVFSYLMALINEPRIVVRHPSGTRQQRRAAHRGMGFAVDAWTRVSWDLSKATIAKINCDPTFHKVPLHWRRGHYRRALPHFKGAIQRPDALRPDDRAGWWQWIGEQWVGHPAFGIKRSIHAPKMSTGALAKRSLNAGKTVLTRLEHYPDQQARL